MEITSCLIPQCDNPAKRRGWCNAHYQRWLKHGDPNRGERLRKKRDEDCLVEGCMSPTLARQMCTLHYNRSMKGVPIGGPALRMRQSDQDCSIPDCARKARARGFCDPHYKRWLFNGDPLKSRPRKKRVGPRGSGPGGKSKTAQGYVNLYWPEHPNARPDGKVLEHTVIMSESISRPLLADENVHHKNGIRDDNRIENLELWTKCQPAGKRVVDLIEYAKQIIKRYGEDSTVY